ncbi:MAG: ATP-binding protein, partial [Cyclobacteriaceae bacterium]
IVNNTIFSINEDTNGNIWLQTNRGITRLNYYSNTTLPVPSSRNFDIKDGLPNTDFLFSTSHKADDGRLYFPSRYGVICFYPEELIESDLPPKIVITDIEINNKPYTHYFDKIGLQPKVKNAIFLKSLELKHSLNRINIVFSALDYFNPSDNQYLAKLEGFEDDWVVLDNTSNVSYNNLSPGKYTLHVKAGNSHNIWNESGISLNIIINPPWWSTWWAYVLYVILSVGVLFLFRHQAIKRERNKNKQRMERMQLEKQLELDKFKLDFFTKITHEIRTPITLIMGPLEKMLQKTRADKEDQKYFKILKSNSDKLYHLTNELLDLRKIDEGKYTLHKTTDDLLPFLQEIISRFTSLVETKKINLTFESNCKSIFWEFDLTALDRIVSNIISNAIKFTEYKGEIHIACSLKERKNKPDQVIIKIKDTGRGIARDDLNEIFKPFYQTRSTESQTIPGTGLGLALVKELCDLHEGKIKVKSKPGKGSTFSLYFDNNLAQLETTNAMIKDCSWLNEYRTINEVVQSEPTAIAAKYKVLIVEDNEELNDFLQTILSDNFKVYSSANGADGYDKAKEIIPDLIISDVMMPVMNGIEMCHKLKQQPLTCHIPILLLTVMANEENQITGYEAGADDYIAKPFNASILQMKVQNLLNLKNNLRLQFAKTFLVDASPENENEIDPLIARIITFIEENLDDADLNILQIQREVGVGRSQLFAKIKNITGLTVTELIQGIRLKKAFEFLSTGKYSVSQTAYMVGFKNLSHFTRLFKERFGNVPSEIAKGQT